MKIFRNQVPRPSDGAVGGTHWLVAESIEGDLKPIRLIVSEPDSYPWTIHRLAQDGQQTLDPHKVIEWVGPLPARTA